MSKITKAQQVRDIIAKNKSKGADAVVELVVARKLLSVPLARIYVRNNWSKATSKKKTVAKKESK